MELDARDVSCLSIETDQANDLQAAMTINNMLNLRLFSTRCRESQSQAFVNQDYALVNVQQDGSSLCFCVCDGVGSSYRGEFAARYLGTRLVNWLHTLSFPEWSSTTITSQLRSHLGAWAREAQKELRDSPVSPYAPTLVREVLAELRDSHGSETVFLGGRISTASWSTGLRISHPAELFFCWMGNITARLFVTEDQYITLGGEEMDGSGWSTALGPRGPLATWNIGLTTVDRLIVYTDGLKTIEKKLPTLDEDGLQANAQQLLLRPESDDMTVLDLHWLYRDTEEGA